MLKTSKNTWWWCESDPGRFFSSNLGFCDYPPGEKARFNVGKVDKRCLKSNDELGIRLRKNLLTQFQFRIILLWKTTIM